MGGAHRAGGRPRARLTGGARAPAPVVWTDESRRGRSGAVGGALAQPVALDLAGGGARQRGYELVLARVLVRRDGLLGEGLEFGGLGRAGLGAVPEHDVGLDDRAALGIGGGDHAGLHHVGVPEQRLFHLGPGDVVAGRDDHVVTAGLVPV